MANWRIPRTTWRHGDVGRLLVTIAADKVSEAAVKGCQSIARVSFGPDAHVEGGDHALSGILGAAPQQGQIQLLAV